MRKNDKKRDNQIRLGLTAVCEHALNAYPGFAWITHIVDYDLYPKSLQIVCIFDTETQLRQCSQNGDKAALLDLIKCTLAKDGIEFKNINQHVSFDTETACEQQHKGNWALRLNERKHSANLH
ncbi:MULTISPECIES: Fis family transcriptional regulator [Shewanella]|uniref:Fis family transcriptional regulator n=1 Tax=Shewanella TaxID=22 RepID=UPI000C568115|nr:MULTISPECIES: Fis family transcriptional regulator [Shewanella]NCQ45900.1 Fis family transcriptional regulator [Shewanella frigidimarina]NCO72087.1 Fis family transcriptional regulator [Shewanella vesiculosa]NCP36571.1 Fis family transcriptional regulator [Shewanella vesiculosa]NCP70884.1 Fis family transcriptional regulator [Shewanella vesiculosa]NCP75405.1 Fis family transcriptional regulator [Shewanella vesiculosa]